jgi:hypothetical protein
MQVVSFYFYWPETNQESSFVFDIYSNGGQSPGLFYYPSTNLFRIYHDSEGGSTYSTEEYAGDQWVRIDIKYDVTNGTLDWQLNGNAQPQKTGIATGTSTYVRPTLTYSATYNLEAYYDDLIISNTSGDYPIGEHVVVGIRPNADGTHDNADTYLENSAGDPINGTTVYAYDKLNENPWSGTEGTDYIQQNATDAAKYVEVQFNNPSIGGTIFGARALMQLNSSGWSTNNGKAYIFDADSQSTTVFSGDHSSEGTVLQYKGAMVTVPSGGWTAAQVNALKARIGYSSDADSPPRWNALIIEVAAQSEALPVGAYVSTTMIGTW